jgi:hypothetical protein
MEEVLAQITDIGKDQNCTLHALQSFRTGADAVSHTNFQLHPTDKLRGLEKCECEAVDRFLIPCWPLANLTKLMRPLNSLSGVWAGLLWGCLFERRVLKYLDGIKTEYNMPIRELTKAKTGGPTAVKFHVSVAKEPVRAQSQGPSYPNQSYSTNFSEPSLNTLETRDSNMVFTIIHRDLNPGEHVIQVVDD